MGRMTSTWLRGVLVAVGAVMMFSTFANAVEICVWVSVPDMTIPGHNNHVANSVKSATACQTACEQMSSFVCRSVEYSPGQQICQMSDRNRATPGVGLDSSMGTTYYERECRTASTTTQATTTTTTTTTSSTTTSTANRASSSARSSLGVEPFVYAESGTSEPEGEAEPEISAQAIYLWIKANPEYMVMIGMGLMIVLLTITIISILCCSGGRDEKY